MYHRGQTESQEDELVALVVADIREDGDLNLVPGRGVKKRV